MSELINKNRRGFLSRLSKPIQNISDESEATLRDAPRPPHAVDEALFCRLCDGCEKCRDACPNSVIEIESELARLNLDYNECSLCEECVKACPTGALHTSIDVNISLRPIFSKGCDNYLQLECNQCESGCPFSAITVEDGELPVLNSELCVGCGQCRSSCYVGAISMQFIA
ncbi:ferredoxin-type protein NapF [Vibrio hannami]|uniref:ferredoxin-type protein NapF n=1 Tax=Vibrio hannami TaxID=2717094 RepID=UPI002410260C|nr:ferredoxin-type protein NapF [Vibrio hannami]MDG3088443.1 ferredoxin-type protein NapF [Vibrio hannami]